MLFDTAKVVQLRHKPEERRLMIREVFTQAKAQGACFHAMISISSHASLLAEVAELRQLLVEEKERVADLGQNTLITEINMLKAELEQETAMNAAERKRHEDLSGKVKKLQNEAKARSVRRCVRILCSTPFESASGVLRLRRCVQWSERCRERLTPHKW